VEVLQLLEEAFKILNADDVKHLFGADNAAFSCCAFNWARSASAVFSEMNKSLPATTPGVAAAALRC